MYKTTTESNAKLLADKHGLLYGFCVVDGKYYVGTKEELQKLPVLIQGSKK